MDVLLVNPPAPWPTEKVEPLGLPYIAALLRQEGLEVEILDAPSQSYDSKEALQGILAKDFKLLGISIPFQEMLEPTLSLINDLRAKGVSAHITMGGHPPTFTYESILEKYQSVDSVVRGGGEYTLLELAKRVCDGNDWTDTAGIAYREGKQTVVTPPRPLIGDLDSLPWPIRDLWKSSTRAMPLISISSSRGCTATALSAA